MNLFFFYFICTLLSYSYLTHSMNTYVCMLRCWKADFCYSRGYVYHLLPTVPAEIQNQTQYNNGRSLNNHVVFIFISKGRNAVKICVWCKDGAGRYRKIKNEKSERRKKICGVQSLVSDGKITSESNLLFIQVLYRQNGT